MKRTVPNVVTKESAFPTTKMIAYDATVTKVTQENLAVSLELRFTFLDTNYSIDAESIPNRLSFLLSEPKSCAQLLQDGFNSSGVYTINPDGGKPIQVLCDMTTDGGGWTVFQRRLDGSVDFYLAWESYGNGFGNLNGEFWLGNDNLHRLTAADDVMLRIDLEDFDGNITYAEYTTFKVADEADKYRLLIGVFNGMAGDCLTYHR